MGKYRPHPLTDPNILGRQAQDLRDLRRQLREERAARRIESTVVPTSSLEDPSAPGFVSLSATNFPVAAVGGYLASGTVTVPSGFVSCVVTLTGRAYAVNSTATDDYLLARLEVGSTLGTALPVHATANGTPGDAPVNVCALSVVVDGLLAGDTFPVRLWAETAGADWTADTANVAEVTGSLVWFA